MTSNSPGEQFEDQKAPNTTLPAWAYFVTGASPSGKVFVAIFGSVVVGLLTRGALNNSIACIATYVTLVIFLSVTALLSRPARVVNPLRLLALAAYLLVAASIGVGNGNGFVMLMGLTFLAISVLCLVLIFNRKSDGY